MSVNDNESIYDNRIAPLMDEIIDICKTNGIPMAATFEYAEDNFCTTVIPQEGQAERMTKVQQAMRRERAYAFAETIVTKPDGKKEITIKRIS